MRVDQYACSCTKGAQDRFEPGCQEPTDINVNQLALVRNGSTALGNGDECRRIKLEARVFPRLSRR